MADHRHPRASPSHQRRSEPSPHADKAPCEAIAAQLIVSFIEALRAAGITVPLDRDLTYTEGLAAVGVDDLAAVYWAGRATLAIAPEDTRAYDLVFASQWLGRLSPTDATAAPITRSTMASASGPDGDSGDRDRRTPRDVIGHSVRELLRTRDLASCSPAELDEAYRLISELRLGRAARKTQRFIRTTNQRAPIDVARTVRLAMRTEGEPLRRAHRRRRLAPRRLILIGDVSGSMEPYARGFLRFMHAAVVALPHGDIEAFALGTRLTRVTRELATHDADRALSAITAVLKDRGGGTRLGEGLHHFNHAYGAPGMARGSTVVVFSDGWDCGDELLLAGEMQRLHRLSHRLIWVNPLRAGQGYAPIARGMAAALPHVDAFVDGHSYASLEELAAMLACE